MSLRRPLDDGYRNWLAVALLGALLSLAAASAHAQDSLRGVALVIGNSEYEHLPALANPARDADAIDKLLDDLGFDVTASTDRDARRLARDLEGFAEDAEGADVAVLYYAGHGIEAGGENFLVPVDADLSALDDAGEKLVPLSKIVAQLKATVPVVLVLLDACRDNPFPAGAQLTLKPGDAPVAVTAAGLGETRSAAPLKQASEPAPAIDQVGTVIGFAAEPGKVALDGDPKGNSPYAAALLRHVAAMSGEEFGTVMRMVTEEVYLKTAGRQRPWINESLRKLLYFGKAEPLPQGAEGDILTERRQLLLSISALPDPERRRVEKVAAEGGVPMDAIYGMLKVLGADVPEDPAQLETLLRDQTAKVKAMIAERDSLKSSDPEIVRLSALADQALAEGALNTAIALRQQAKARAKEVEAKVEDAEAELRQRRIELAEVYAKSAEAYALAFKHREAGVDYEEASRQLERWDDQQAFWYMRAASTAYLEAGKLRGGARDLKRATETGRRAAQMAERLLADNPDESQFWQDVSAQTLNNLANAANSLFSATRERDALNEAVDAYERSLKVLSRDRVEQDWVVVQHNLAGALMLLGELDLQEETLQRAIDAYEASLTVWTPEFNPEKWALAIANLGNAQTSLGRRSRDQALLRKAIASFDSALTVQTQATTPLDWAWTNRERADAYSELAAITRDPADLAKATASSQEALKVYTLDVAPRNWAQTMHDMAYAFQKASSPETLDAALQKANAIYAQVIAAISADEQPVEYAISLANLGSGEVERGKIHKDQPMVEGGIARLRDAVARYEAMGRMNDVAFRMQEIGNGLTTLGHLRSSQPELLEAIGSFDGALAIFRKTGLPGDVEAALRGLSYAQVELGYQRSLAGDYRGALEVYRASLANRDRQREYQNWLFSANQVAIALHNLGAAEQGVDTLREAAAAYRVALAATPADTALPAWTETQNNLIGVLRTIGERTLARDDILAMASAYGELAAATGRDGDAAGRDLAEANRAWALGYAGEVVSDRALLEEAAATYRAAFKGADISGPDHVFHVLNFARTLFLAASLGADDAVRREAVDFVDANWALVDREATPEQKVNGLLDRANLIYALSLSGTPTFDNRKVEDAFARAVAAADEAGNPDLWRNAQRMLASFQLAEVDRPDFSSERLDAGLDTLRKLLAATPKQAAPKEWAEAANWYGYALSVRGKRESATASFEEALPLLRDALSAYQAGNDAVSAAHTRDSLCTALVGLGSLRKERALVAEGAEECGQAVAFMREHRMSEVLPIAEANRAQALNALAAFDGAAARP